MSLDLQRQFDIPLTRGYYYTIPDSVTGRLTGQDYVYFDILDIDPRDYVVIVEGYNGTFRSVGPLFEQTRLPHVQLASDAMLLVVPKSLSLPTFAGVVQRGKRYRLSLGNLRYKNMFLLK
jgi:hypothetical protein